VNRKCSGWQQGIAFVRVWNDVRTLSVKRTTVGESDHVDSHVGVSEGASEYWLACWVWKTPVECDGECCGSRGLCTRGGSAGEGERPGSGDNGGSGPMWWSGRIEPSLGPARVRKPGIRLRVRFGNVQTTREMYPPMTVKAERMLHPAGQRGQLGRFTTTSVSVKIK
jgi:hypothetical protein